MGPRLVAAARVGEAPEPSDPKAQPGGSANDSDARPSTARPSPRPIRLSAPVTFLYGSHDWMDKQAGASTAAQLRSSGVDAACLITPAAGHHLYMEQPDVFCGQVLGRLRETGQHRR